MSFIRSKTEERTGYQNGTPLVPCFDNQCDFVMVYRLDDTTTERIRQYRDKGYVIHFMTGISWGHYLPYLNGGFDGETHWDEAQTDRFGNMILHSPNVPYMVPTVSFADYIAETLKAVVDEGVEAIHVEEPEFWDRAGYSPAFKREYELYYKTPWRPPYESVDAAYKCAKLKQYLYTRTIDRVSTVLKDYSLKKYKKALRFYVPTHSLLNYTQWKIVSPEGKLADIPCVDGCIAQVWTGTSREKNWYEGIYAERTFETAFLEYGVMQELVKNTGRKMWFLHDPIEDNPIFDWDDYRKNYLCTVAASLLHPKINQYEICPWPYRVFMDKYPKNNPEGVTIPPEYATLLNNMFNTLGTLEPSEEEHFQVGVIMADAQLYQRAYPDHLFAAAQKQEVGTVLVESNDLIADFKNQLLEGHDPNGELLLKYMQSATFPGFYGLALPLLKNGVEVRPVLLDNVRRYPGYLDDYKVLLVSYEYLKPEFPDMNTALAAWVKEGGILLYVGDGSDPFHQVKSWWEGKYSTPAEHLFEMLGIQPTKDCGIYPAGKGFAAVWKINPAKICFSQKNADLLRAFYVNTLSEAGIDVRFSNHLQIRRKEYLIAAVMDESAETTPFVIKGRFVDMFTPAFDVITDKTLQPGENCMLCDLDRVTDATAVLGTSVRILELTETEDRIVLRISGASDFRAYIRLKLSKPCKQATIDNAACDFSYEEDSKTALLSFNSVDGERTITII